MLLLVQQYLINHSFSDLEKDHGVFVSFAKSKQKVSLNYGQIEAQESDPLAQECRGLILSKLDGSSFSDKNEIIGETKVLAYPMKRFFNHGQGAAAPIDWSKSGIKVLEKLDGTLCIIYFDSFTNQWCVATRSVPEADILLDNGIFTFRTLFEKAVKETLGISFGTFTVSLVKEMTYCFELTTPYNQIVVKYPTCKITLLAARYLPNLQEVDINELAIVQVSNVPAIQSYPLSKLNEVILFVNERPSMEHEGVVVRDSDFNRIKIKNPGYCDFAKIRDHLSSSKRNIVSTLLRGNEDDMIPFLPEEIVNNLLRMREGLRQVFKDHDERFRVLKTEVAFEDTRKDFAAKVLSDKRYWQAPLFKMFDGVPNMKEFCQNASKEGEWSSTFLDKILELIEKT